MSRRIFRAQSFISFALGFAISASSSLLQANYCSRFPSFTYIKSVRTLPGETVTVDLDLPHALRFAHCDPCRKMYIAQGRKLAILKITYNGDTNDPRNVNKLMDYLEFLSVSGSIENEHTWHLYLAGNIDASNSNIWHTWILEFSTDGGEDFIIHEGVIPASSPGGYKVVVQEKIPVHIERYTTFDNGPEFEALRKAELKPPR